MTTKRSVILKGCPEVNEDGVAASTVKPGYLVKGVSSIAHQTAAGTAQVPKAVALERDEFGTGIDNTYQGQGTISAYYASGDVVKVGVFKPGEEATLYIASGENISEDDNLVSNGDGTLKEGSTAGAIVGRAKETLGLVNVVTACRVEFL